MENNIDILLSRTDRCVSCLERWVDNKNLTLNAACLLLVKTACNLNNNSSFGAEQKLVDTIYNHIKEYVHAEYELRRKRELNEK